MPTWFRNSATGTAYAPVYQTATATTLGSASALYRAMLSDQTQTTSSGLYNWVRASNATIATTATNSSWYIIEEDHWVDSIQYLALAKQRVVQTVQRTAEQQREYEERRLLMQQEQLRLAQERAAALGRSRELLLAHLTAEQRKSFNGKRFFIVEGGRSKQAYRIRDCGSYSANVDVLEGKPGKVTHRLCCHLSDSRVPLYDHLLAQKVWIESDEDAFLRQANRHAA